MNIYFALAAGLALIVGLAHTILGELLLIRRLSSNCVPALAGSTDLARRTLRATWHLPTALAWGFAAILLRFSLPAAPDAYVAFVESAAALSLLAGSLIFLFCTKGKHPGWVGLLAIAVLGWLGRM